MTNNEKIIKMLPTWFKEKYKVELENYQEAGRYWIHAEDLFKVIDEVFLSKPQASAQDKEPSIHFIKNDIFSLIELAKKIK